MKDKNPVPPDLASPFDISKLEPREIRAMFMAVSARSLDNWIEYYEAREEYEVCVIIKEVRDIKSIAAGHDDSSND